MFSSLFVYNLEFSTYHIIIVFYADNKVQRCISSVYNLVLSVFQEAALVFSAAEALSNELTLKRDSLAHAKAIEVFGQARLPLLVDHQDKVDIIRLKIHCFIIIIYLVEICD